jgi:hypothetical protein
MDKPKLTPKDFFLYVGALITLYWSAGSLVALLFSIIDTLYRDQLDYFVDPYSGGIRFAIASLVVVFPISLWLFTLIKKGLAVEPTKLGLGIRRWLFALTLFVASAALLGDLIALINGFLGGELTARFVWKVLVVLVVAGLFFWYFLLELRARPDAPLRLRKWFLVDASILVIASIVYGFVVMGSPGEIRTLRFDERRVSDLQSIQWQVVNFWQQKQKLPALLSELEDPLSGFRVPTDPKTSEAYGFVPKTQLSFDLCADFELPSAQRIDRGFQPYHIAEPYTESENWEHVAGKVCFSRTIDPDRYPPYAKTR